MKKVARRTTPASPEPETVAAHPEVVAAHGAKGDPYLGVRHDRTVIGIDASLTGTAIACYDPDTGAHGAYRLKPKHKGVRRLLEIQNFVYSKVHLARMVSREVPHVVLEDYAMGIRGGRVFSIGEGGGAVKLGLIQALGLVNREAYPHLVSPPSLKKFVTGDGRSDKSDMKMVTLKRWGVEFKDDNECDAFGLAQIAALIARPDLAEEAPKFQQEVLKKVTWHAEWPDDPA